MYGLTRATLTLIGVAAVGVLLWLATAILPASVSDASLGAYWAAFGVVALGGLAMALSQLLGGWTKWGWPRVSGKVFLLAFLPALVVGGWMLAAHEPENYWLGRHIRSWSGDIGIDGLVDALGLMTPAIAFGIGLVFGLTFDTTGPRVSRRMKPVPAGGARPRPAVDGGGKEEEDRRVRFGNGDTPEPAERPAEPAQK